MRLLSGLALGLAAGAAALPGVAGAAPDVTIAVTPGAANPGTTVTITGSCGTGVSSATVTSGAFPAPVPMAAVNGVLTAQATIPAGTTAQGYTVTITCPGGSLSASTTLWVISVTTASAQAQSTPSAAPSPTGPGPATGGGGTSGDRAAMTLAAGVAVLCAGLVLALRRRRA